MCGLNLELPLFQGIHGLVGGQIQLQWCNGDTSRAQCAEVRARFIDTGRGLTTDPIIRLAAGIKALVQGKRYFEGQIWVDDRDLQIVKSEGKPVPEIKSKGGQENLFPRFTTYREQIDGKFWFPSRVTRSWTFPSATATVSSTRASASSFRSRSGTSASTARARSSAT